MKFIGLDFETSGSDINDGAVPIQLGLATRVSGKLETTSLLIGGWQWGKDATWSDEAEEIHGFSKQDLEGIEPVRLIDIRLAHWLIHVGKATGPRMWNLAVGWNVAGFDMPFIRKYMPALSSLLSYRTIDLNALVLAASNGQVSEYKRIKSLAKDGAAHAIGREAAWHDAGYDAEASLRAYEYLAEYIKGYINGKP